MDVGSRRITLTAWGRLYGFDKATTSRLHLTGRLPPELQIEQLPNGRYYVVVPPDNDARCVVYARVSSGDQSEDLDRQVGRVVAWATEQGHRPDEVAKEIGSGLDGNRRQVRRVMGDPTVGMIIVEHRERLCRFGLEYVEAALAGRGARILVMDEGELEDDLVRDVTEVMTSLCARLYGRRSVRRRAERVLAAAETVQLLVHTRPASPFSAAWTVWRGMPRWQHTPGCTAGFSGSCSPTFPPVGRLVR